MTELAAGQSSSTQKTLSSLQKQLSRLTAGWAAQLRRSAVSSASRRRPCGSIRKHLPV